jgi:hypothetical protein
MQSGAPTDPAQATASDDLGGNAITGSVPEIWGRHRAHHPSGGGMSDYTVGSQARRRYEDSRQAMEDASRPVSIPDAPAGAPPVAPSFGHWGGSAGTLSSRHIYA